MAGRRRIPRGPLVVAIAAAAAACQLVVGIERTEKSAASNDVDAAPPARPDPCRHVLPPSMPEEDDDRSTQLPTLYLAFKKIALQPPEESSGVGFDLDGVCTCDRRPDTFFDGGSSCVPRRPEMDCDADGGIDNKVGEIVAAFHVPGTPTVDETAQAPIDIGLRTLLLSVGGWNGKANDKDIEVGFVPSRGISDVRGCDPDARPGRSPPRWCGKDRWSYPTESVVEVGGAKVPLVRSAGYVSDGTLVLRRSGPAVFFLGSVPVTIQSPLVVGKLDVNETGVRRLTGILAGRIEERDLLAGLGQFEMRVVGRDSGPEPDGGWRMCWQPSFPLFRTAVCDSADISRGETFDLAGGRCDALSVAMSFVAEEAELGEERSEVVEPNECAPNVLEDRTIYTCP